MSDCKRAKYWDAEKWKTVNPQNIDIMEEFLSSKKELSDKSLDQYKNALQIFFLWVLDKSGNKFIVELKKRDILKYQNYLIDEGLSSNAIKLKRSAVSSLCNYIENYYDDEYPTFRNIVKGVQTPVGEKIHKKEPLTMEELELLRQELIAKEMWQHLAYLDMSYDTAGRREEIRQVLKEVVDNSPNEKGFYFTNELRCKGRSKQGKRRKLFFSQQAMDSVKKWLEVRGEDDCPYLFVNKTKDGHCEQISETSFNYWCTEIFTKIVGRRVHPHLFRSSRATNLVTVQNKDINSARSLLGHADISTTQIYVIRDESESLNDCF